MAVYVVSAHLIGDDLGQTVFQAGDQVRLDLAIWAPTGLADPGVGPTMRQRVTGGTVTTPTPVKDAVGLYHLDVIAAVGTTDVTWIGTGANPGTASVSFDTLPRGVP